jgi:SsrA-binding protein
VNKKTPTPTSAAPKKAASKASDAPQETMIAENRKARHKYEILETVECGMILRGTEVKSLRNGKCSLDESYGRISGGTLWLVGCDIPEYKQGGFWNHEPKRNRQLLLHKREMNRFVGRATEKGLTLVPLKLYFNQRGIAKCLLGLCKGMQMHDKREKLKQNDARREMERAVRKKVR